MKWRTSKSEKMEVAWFQIEKELATIGEIQHRDLLDIDHVEFLVSGVKFSFYACDKYSPVSEPLEFLNNLKIADIKSIGAMKMEVKIGDQVIYSKYAGTDVKLDDEEYIVVKQSDILAVIEA
mgnify:CR=1 FL=1